MGWMTQKRGVMFWATLPFFVAYGLAWVTYRAVRTKLAGGRDEVEQNET